MRPCACACMRAWASVVCVLTEREHAASTGGSSARWPRLISDLSSPQHKHTQPHSRVSPPPSHNHTHLVKSPPWSMNCAAAAEGGACGGEGHASASEAVPSVRRMCAAGWPRARRVTPHPPPVLPFRRPLPATHTPTSTPPTAHPCPHTQKGTHLGDHAVEGRALVGQLLPALAHALLARACARGRARMCVGVCGGGGGGRAAQQERQTSSEAASSSITERSQ